MDTIGGENREGARSSRLFIINSAGVPVMAIKGPVTFDPQFFLSHVSDGLTIAKYKKRQVVYTQGDVADAIFYLQSGRLKLAVVSSRGKEAVVAIVSANEFFGEGCLAGQLRRLSTVSTLIDAVVVRVGKPAFVRVLHQEPSFAALFTSYLLARTLRVESDLVDQLFNSSEKRLARLLLLLANYGQEAIPVPFFVKISQETLAEMVGTTRSRVSFFMNKFRRLGFIDYNGGIEVHPSLLGLVLHEQPKITA
jgi:CRP/FNR family cyclic AMP-dependent transcriptional regulator